MMIRNIIIYSILCLFLFCIDQYTKYMILSYMSLGDTIVIIPHFFHLTYIRNYGAVFGFLNNSNTDWQFWLFMVSIVLVCIFVIYTLRTHKKNTWIWISCSFLLAGGFGNTVDRIRFRYVVDFFDFFIGQYHWPAFNFADCYIIIAIIILLFEPYLNTIILQGEE